MEERVIAVTGGFGALGAAVGQAALAAGWSVALIDRTWPDSVDARALALGGIDLTDLAAAQSAMQAVRDRFGRLDALANVAGGFAWQTLEDGDLAAWDRLFALNVKTAACASKAALPHLREAPGDAAIANVAAQAALKAGAGMGAYAASKAGVLKLTESLAEELKPTNVRVNAVLPSIIDTVQNRADMPDADPAAWVRPAELAAVILFLASPAASAVRGAQLAVSGRV